MGISSPRTICTSIVYHKILSVSNKGCVPEICVIQNKYGIIEYLLPYVYGGQFPTRICCKAIVKEAVANHERDRCNKIISDKSDVPIFLGIMRNKLCNKAFPFYVISMKDHSYAKLPKFARLACLHINEVQRCKLRSNEFTVVMHIIMECTDLN